MSYNVIETHGEKGVEWGVGILSSNPSVEYYLPCQNKVYAFALKYYLETLVHETFHAGRMFQKQLTDENITYKPGDESETLVNVFERIKIDLEK
jgi:hypothetical protein